MASQKCVAPPGLKFILQPTTPTASHSLASGWARLFRAFGAESVGGQIIESRREFLSTDAWH